jgi:hypothetical protein
MPENAENQSSTGVSRVKLWTAVIATFLVAGSFISQISSQVKQNRRPDPVASRPADTGTQRGFRVLPGYYGPR